MSEKFPRRPGEINTTPRDIIINKSNHIQANIDNNENSLLNSVLRPAYVQDYTLLSKNASEYLVYGAENKIYIKNSRAGISGISKEHILFGIQASSSYVDVYQSVISDAFSSNNSILVSTASSTLIALHTGAWDDQLRNTTDWSDKYIQVKSGGDINSIYKILSYNYTTRTFAISETVNGTLENNDVISIVTKIIDNNKPFWLNVPVFDAGTSLPANIISNNNTAFSPFVKKAFYHDKDYSTVYDRYYIILTDKNLVSLNNITSSEIDSSTLQLSSEIAIPSSGAFNELLIKESLPVNDYTQFGNIDINEFEFIDVDTFEIVDNSIIKADLILPSGVMYDKIVIYDSSQV
jgi:hypothetical protein